MLHMCLAYLRHVCLGVWVTSVEGQHYGEFNSGPPLSTMSALGSKLLNKKNVALPTHVFVKPNLFHVL